MQFGVDPFAFTVALVAIWVAWAESRRNNRVILKARECRGSSLQTARSGSRLYHQFEILIQNRGISLYNVAVSLSFRPKNGAGWLNLPLRCGSDEPQEDTSTSGQPEFARGMVARFFLNTNDPQSEALTFLQMLEDPRTQDACLNVFAQGYLAYSFRIGGSWDRVRTRWNRLAYWFNNLFQHSHGPSAWPHRQATEIVHIPEILPQCVTLEHALTYFVESTRRKGQRVDNVQVDR